MMRVLETTYASTCPHPEEEEEMILPGPPIFVEIPEMRVRDRSHAVRKLAKLGLTGEFIVIPERCFENSIEMEKAKVSTEVYREKQSELEIPE